MNTGSVQILAQSRFSIELSHLTEHVRLLHALDNRSKPGVVHLPPRSD
jgi:hypothetical protein